MREFKLYVKNEKTTTLISQFDNWSQEQAQPLSSVYDEHLTEAENDQYTLTFNVASVLPTKDKNGNQILVPNYYLNLLKIGQELRLEMDYSDKVIDLVITSISPTYGRQTTIFAYTAQDVLSYRWAKINRGYSYTSYNRTNTYEEILTPKTIERMVFEICEDNFLSGWQIIGPAQHETFLYNQKCIAEEIGDNPYNAIIEVCNLFQAFLKVDYFRKTLSFYAKQDRKFSGYRYWANTNIKTISKSEDGAELAAILRVSGGTDDVGAEITLVPAIPSSLAEVLSYYKNYSPEDEDQIISWGNPLQCEIDFGDKFYWNDDINFDATAYENGEFTIDKELKKYIKNITSTDPGWPTVIRWMRSYYRTLKDDALSAFNNLLDYDTAAIDTSTGKTGNELVPILRQFLIIANQVPHLDQYLINWGYFDNLHFMTNTAKTELNHFYRTVLPAANIQIKLLTTAYYSLQYEVASIETSLKVLAESRIANCKSVAKEEETQQNTYTKIVETLADLSNQMLTVLRQDNYSYFKYLSYLYGSNNLSEYWYQTWMSKYENYKTLYDEAVDKCSTYVDIERTDISNIDPVKLQMEVEKASWEQKRDLYKSLTIGWSIEQGDGFNEPGLYELLYNTVMSEYDTYTDISDTHWSYATSLEEQIELARDIIRPQMQSIYASYGRYLLETTYENTDETESVSLFEQAKAHFDNVKQPSINLSISTINLHDLERIAVPALRVGNMIYVSNPYDNKEDKVIITNLDYNMRLPDAVSVTVENISKYKNTLYKLIKSVQ